LMSVLGKSKLQAPKNVSRLDGSRECNKLRIGS
jgi:hypothetical protein